MSRITILILLSFLFVSGAFSHPHELVAMRTEVKFDQNGNAIAFEHQWAFDQIFTAYALEGQDKNDNGEYEQSELIDLLNEILVNIAPIDYYTVFDSTGVVPEFAEATPVSAELSGRNFVVKYQIPFLSSVSLVDSRMRYAIYDDEYYTDLFYDEKVDSVTLTDAPEDCESSIERPSPSDDLVLFAASLDQTESSGGGLGIHFADWVSVKCG